VRTKRRLALSVLLAAAVVAVLAYPFRHSWWGGWILAVAEAGIVGGLADWFAVTALFRRPLGLPIPHTGLIPNNWEMLAQRVGTMVGDRVLTREYLAHELARIDVADLIARFAERLSRRDLETATRAALEWVARELPASGTADVVARLQRFLAARPLAPLLASALDLARQHGWLERAVGAVARALSEALERPEVRQAVGDLLDEILAHYRARTGLYPRLAIGLADLFGLIDRARLVAALHAGLADVAADAEHPLRRQLADAAGELAERLRRDAELADRVEGFKAEAVGSPVLTRLVEDVVAAVRQALASDLARPASETVTWLTDRLERWRRGVLEDPALRSQADRWVKARALEALDRHHGRIATLIEKGVRALGPQGAVRLVEEHAGDDLQYIRVNGTVVGGLAGGALYGLHLLLRLW
jgi:uncharacterized membrane-anchored protein YjiN (DUF445 family)